MESRANYALVGLFTLAVLAALFGFVYWFNSGAGSRTREVRVIFSGTVTGLGRGSSVLFNGLRIGEVTTIQLQPDDPRRIYAVIKVDDSTPLKVDTRARIEAQGLAGVVAVQLLGGDPASPPLVAQPGQSLPVIIAERSEFQDSLETVRTISKRADDVLGSVESLVKDNAGPISNTVKNVERFSAALGDNADGVGKLMASFGQIAETISPLTAKLGTLSDELSEVVRSIDQAKITNTLDNIEKFTASLGNSGDDVAKTAREAAALTQKLNTAIDSTQLSNTLNNIDRFVAVLGNSGEQVQNAIRDVAAVSDRVNRALDGQKLASTLDNIEKFSAALGGSSAEAGRAVNNVASITDKLNRAADQVEGVLKAAEAFLNSAAGEEGKGTFAEIAKAAQSIRVLADNLDARTAQITAGINRFTGPGLRDIESLASDGKRTLNEVSRTLRSLERNPQQLIFGGKPSLPQYGGSR
jgi:phospholipid/cholesterol/gamma-HCH transport system substrate-binding protein